LLHEFTNAVGNACGQLPRPNLTVPGNRTLNHLVLMRVVADERSQAFDQAFIASPELRGLPHEPPVRRCELCGALVHEATDRARVIGYGRPRRVVEKLRAPGLLNEIMHPAVKLMQSHFTT
jgi:hypothetical protein